MPLSSRGTWPNTNDFSNSLEFDRHDVLSVKFVSEKFFYQGSHIQ